MHSRLVNDLLRKLIQLLIRETHNSTIQNMIVISATVEPNEFHLRKLTDLGWCPGWSFEQFDQTLHTSNKWWRDLGTPHSQRRQAISSFFGASSGWPTSPPLRLKLHFRDGINASFRLIRTAVGKRNNPTTKIRHVVTESVVICVLKNLIDEINWRFRCWVDFFIQISLNEISRNFIVRSGSFDP